MELPHDDAVEPFWEWMPGDVDFEFEIPDSERVPGTRVLESIESENCANLRGRSLDEVLREASRIKLGGSFHSFAEFDRCLDSWCVVNGRAAHRFKTRKDLCVRVCRFGPKVRP